MPVIAVFAGHGGSDYGAAGNGFIEKNLNLALSNETTRILRGRGYSVINNRVTDVNRSITQDAALANSSNADAVVEIHMNSNAGTPGTGTETFYSIRDRGPGRALATAITRNIAALGFVNRGARTRINYAGEDALGIIRLTNAPAVLVEAAFINNPGDMARFDVGAISKAIADAVTEVFPISAPPVGGDPIVRQIQATLNQRYNAGLTITGIVGPLTRRAMVRGLQTELNRQFGRNLAVDGIFGPLTRAATVNVRRGARGNITYLIQAALYGRGYTRVIPDGVFGPITEQAVRAFQIDHRLALTGVAGPNTQFALFRQ
ncbi:MAG: N-acetylmuramoyl-L-alanine amidase [Oscillospiraceae bacterium]|nr:N-acetylmuramoyl-L-alanine amidase [Oscillospiraceae bacterium]